MKGRPYDVTDGFLQRPYDSCTGYDLIVISLSFMRPKFTVVAGNGLGVPIIEQLDEDCYGKGHSGNFPGGFFI